MYVCMYVRTFDNEMSLEKKKEGQNERKMAASAECVTLTCSLTLCFPPACTQGSGRRDEEKEREAVGQRAKFSKGKLRTGPASTNRSKGGKSLLFERG